MIKKLKLLLVVAMMFGFSNVSQAVLVTDALTSPTATVDFSQFNTDWVFGTGPVEVGGLVGESISWSSTYSYSVIGNSGYGLGGNGNWNSGRNGYVGLNTSATNQSMRFDFNDGPISGVAGFVNYAPENYGDFFIEVLGLGDVVLESYNITSLAPISTPGQTNAGEFRGITRGTADIYAFRLSGAYDVLDDLQFTRVPEPATLILLGLGLLGFASRKKV